MKTYHKQNRTFFLGALVSILISNVFAVILQFFKGDVLDYAVAGEIRATLHSVLLLFSFILGEVLLFFCYRQFSAKYVVGCTRSLKQDIFASILRRDYVRYKERQQGEYISKYTNEADSIKSGRFEMLPLFWEILFKIVFVSIALFLLDWRIAFVTLALLTTPLYIPKLIEKPLQKAQSEYLKALEVNLAKLNDWLSGFEIIKNFSAECKIISLFEKSNVESMDKLLQNKQIGAVSQLITTLISYLSYFVVLVCATCLVLNGDFSAGDFLVAIGMIDQLSYPLISLAEIIRQMIAIQPACKSLEQFVAEPTAVKSPKQQKNFQNKICFRDVTFAYEGQPPILNHFQFTIQKGERYLLRGPSGCGKTTTVNLLLRYFDAQSGSITVDDTPIADIGSTYGWMTVVRQDAVLFHDTLRNNLTMYTSVPDEKLVDLLNRLGLEKYAKTEALDHEITEGGANLSGGEKKRICLARALLRESEILILDEPLANLDEETVSRIEDLILSIKNRTILIVSHQFSEEKLEKFHQVLNFTKNT